MKKSVGWSKEEYVRQNGYTLFFLNDVLCNANPFVKPDGYDAELIESQNQNWENTGTSKMYPDIILILNESFNDLSLNAEIHTDVDYLKDFYNIPNAIYGYSVSSLSGGGTNNSEYELLTSNSMALLSVDAPFNYLDTSKSASNIVEYLKTFGYETWAFHCCPGNNYYRNVGYPGLGFEHILFEEDFTICNKNGNRMWKDIDNYWDLIKEYENASERPRFMYMLTFQNHGGYDQNPSELDTVHMLDDHGDVDEQISEYLSSVELSSKAFKELISYFSNESRPAIICMVGDHTFSDISHIVNQDDMSSYEYDIKSKTVPFVLWSNTSIECIEGVDKLSMVDIVPAILYSAGVPLSDYYKLILNCHREVPIRTRSGCYFDIYGQYGNYYKDKKYLDIVNQYLYAEYNGISRKSDYRPELFRISK